MVEHTQIEVEQTPEVAPTHRLWLAVIVVISVILFFAGPSVTNGFPRAQELVQESAAWADTLMEGGLDNVRAETRALSPPGLLTRWLTTAVLLLNPTGDDVTWSRAVACLILMLCWWGITRFIMGSRVHAREPVPWIVLCVLLACEPIRAIAGGDLINGWTLGAGVIFVLACKRLTLAPETTWGVGALWGLLALIHPALLALGIPIFIFASQAYRTEDASAQTSSGHAALPSVPLSLLLSPVVATLVLVSLWWCIGGSMRDLTDSIDLLWRQSSPAVGAHAFGASPGMSMWAGFQSMGWVPTLLALGGLALPGPDRPMKIALFLGATVLIAGGLDGELHHPEASLMVFLTPCIATLAVRIPRKIWSRFQT